MEKVKLFFKKEKIEKNQFAFNKKHTVWPLLLVHRIFSKAASFLLLANVISAFTAFGEVFGFLEYISVAPVQY